MGSCSFYGKFARGVFSQRFPGIILVECGTEKYYNISVLLYINGRNRLCGCR